jgi:hypothetical protein
MALALHCRGCVESNIGRLKCKPSHLPVPADAMSSNALVRRAEYDSSLNAASSNLRDLTRRCNSNHHVEEYMGRLAAQLNTCHTEFCDTEKLQTFPTLQGIYDSLSHLTSSSNSSIFTPWHLDSKSAELTRITEKHTAILSRIKTIENGLKSAESGLRSTALAMKQRGKDNKAGAAAAAIVGGMLAPFTFGASLLVGGAVAKGLFDDGEELMVAYRDLRGESNAAVTSFSRSVAASIDIIQKISMLVRGILEEVRSLSASESKLQMLRAVKKAEYLREILKEFLKLKEY